MAEIACYAFDGLAFGNVTCIRLRMLLDSGRRVRHNLSMMMDDLTAYDTTSNENVDENTLDWRERAVDASLEQLDDDGLPSPYVILNHIRRHRRGCHTLSLAQDRLQMLKFLQEQAQNVRSLLPGSSINFQRNVPCPFVAWYACEWDKSALEVVFTPSEGYGKALVVGDDENVVKAFGEQAEKYAIRPDGRCLVFSRLWESAPDMDAEIGSVTWNDVILPANVLSGVREAVEGFAKHKRAYDMMGFAWRRGLLLVGPPGTGKTMLCKAAAAALPDMPFLYVRDLATGAGGHGSTIQIIFERARKLAPCVLAFEDIDGMVTSANRSLFLNELDGFRNNDGLLIIASSNHPGKIDEALLKRPSRFDRVFHIGLPALPERRAYAQQLLSRSSLTEQIAGTLDTDDLAQRVAERTEGFTPAYLKEAFISAALRQAQEGAEILDQRFADAVLEQIEELRAYLHQVKDPDAMGDFINPESTPIGIRRNR